ncbi:cyclic beta 1-2 glucan synthetase, partial [Massilia arenosa]
LAIRVRIVLEPDETAVLDFVTGVAPDRAAAQDLARRYQDRQAADRVFDLAWTHGQVVLRQLNASTADARRYAGLAAAVVFNVPRLRADPATIARNQRGQSGLWAYSISGDLPIVLLRLRDPAHMELARQMVQAHEYWRLKGLAVDLVIWCHDREGYRQGLRDQLMGLVTSAGEAQALDRPGGIFVRLQDQVPPEDQVLIAAVARVVLDGDRGALDDQLRRAVPRPLRVPVLAADARAALVHEPVQLELPELMLANGTGGFSADGREYVIRTRAGAPTPAPWCNVLANPWFGSVVSESGQACTWAENAHEFRLTPWDNDPVSDTSGEAFYVRDEHTGHFWSPAPLPAAGQGDYLTRHGLGYSVFEHVEDGLHTELTVFVAADAGIKYSILKVRNDSSMKRRVALTGYVEWVLGEHRDRSAPHVVTEIDPASGALFARNGYNTEFAGRMAFFHADARSFTVTADREEFLGRQRSLRSPAAMLRARLSSRTGAGYDPCAAIMVPLELPPGETQEVVFALGVSGRRTEELAQMIATRTGAVAAYQALAKVKERWEGLLGGVQVETPDPELNVLANGWLPYQVIASRLWGRSGYYQSGGAFGFRDQLQDAVALVHADPQLLREQILLAASRQFPEGDVQHWWHPPSGRGVRTMCSDDYLWLPFAVHAYVSATGDRAVLDEAAGFIEGRPLKEHEESYYDLPQPAQQHASLYEHCVRALRHGLRFGEHGLPLMGSGDWNDGMDRVGAEGKGESVWLGWFLCDVLRKFEGVARLQGDQEFAATCREQAQELALNLERHAWDGEWYRRAYFDDGTPLGTAAADECRIDSISQSWAVLSAAGDPQRARKAMRQVDQLLVRRELELVQLLDPPFDAGRTDPGYIRGYVPGVRENGGQYTHAAVWAAMAFARLGDGPRAWELCRMINPVNHARDAEGVERYRVEPYVMAADVYSARGHEGRGGWTWYTGSAGWMYRLLVESLLGLHVEADRLTLAPLLPPEWPGFRLRLRWRSATYAISVERGAEWSLALDGQPQARDGIVLADDHREHEIRVTLGDAS